NSPCGWDYAAGHALIRAAGGVLLDEAGRDVTYTLDGISSTHFCFGGGPRAALDLVARAKRAIREAEHVLDRYRGWGGHADRIAVRRIIADRYRLSQWRPRREANFCGRSAGWP